MAIVNILIALVNSMSVTIVVAYVLTRSRFFSEVLEKKLSAKNGIFLAVIFGIFAIYGTLSGFSVLGAVANTRYIGPVLAGIIGGPVVGLGAGLIGGMHRYFFGGFTYFESGLSTVVAGLAAGLVFQRGRFDKNGYVNIAAAAIFSAVIQVYHLGQILLLCKPFEKALGLVENIAIPMVIANAGGVAIFIFIVNNLKKEHITEIERDRYLQAKERIESELQVATDIQMSMVPHVFTMVPTRSEFELYATLKPAKEVGGDLYDFFLTGDDHVFFTVGDVSDKGVPAALLMAVTKTFLKGSAAPGLTPSDILSRVNSEISVNNDSLMFVTCFCAKLNCRTGELIFSNAGHNPPVILRSNGSAEWLSLPQGLVLGVDGGARYRSETIRLMPGDAVLAYTDGVTEAMNANRQLFSQERLIQISQGYRSASAREIVEGVSKAVKDFTGEAKQSDDITVLSIKYHGPGGKG